MSTHTEPDPGAFPLSGGRCQCRQGFYLCPTAEALWQETKRTFRQALQTGSFAEYDQASEIYRRHMAGVIDVS